MKYKIDTKSEKSAYLQLYEQLKTDIINGAYTYQTKIPSKRLLAEETGVSVITVEHAYSLLCDEGYIESRERSGYFVIFSESEYFTHSKIDDKSFRKQRFAETEVQSDFPFSVIAKTMRKVLAEYGEEILKKAPNCGCNDLRIAISRYLSRSRGIEADYKQIIIGSGAEYLYGLIIEMLGRERIYAIEDPSYEKIEMVYRAGGVKCEMLALGTDGIKSICLAKTNASVLHITPYRSFPSGVTASAPKRMEYLRWAEKCGGYIVEDDFESEFTLSQKPEETVFSMSDKDNVIYLNTFSKTVCPAVRVGYMVLPMRLVEVFEKTVGFYSCTVPTFEQYVLAELISSGDFERHINRVRRKKRKEQE